MGSDSSLRSYGSTVRDDPCEDVRCAMNEVRAYREETGLTQAQLANEINMMFGTNYDKAIISKVESGDICLPQIIIDYIASKIDFKAVATDADERKGNKWGIIPRSEKNSPKSAISEKVLEELRFYTKDHPFIAQDFADSLGVREVQIRAAIRELRLNHIRVCSDPAHRGYWLEENGGGYEVTRKQMLSRAFRLLEVVKAMDNNQDGQFQWESERG